MIAYVLTVFIMNSAGLYEHISTGPYEPTTLAECYKQLAEQLQSGDESMLAVCEPVEVPDDGSTGKSTGESK